jgi:hypothetical protein
MKDRSSNRTPIKVPASGPVATTSYQSSSIIGLNSDWPPKSVDGLKILGYEMQMFLGLVPIALDPDRFRQDGERLLKHAVVEAHVCTTAASAGFFWATGVSASGSSGNCFRGTNRTPTSNANSTTHAKS